MANIQKDTKKFIYWSMLIVVRLFLHLSLEIPVLYNDSKSYIDYSFSRCLRGPLYPIFIDFFQLLLSEKYYLGVIIFQILIGLVAVVVLRLTIEETLNAIFMKAKVNSDISYILAFIYGTSPIVVNWDLVILSESLALSITCFFIFFSVRYIVQENEKDGLLAVIFSLTGFFTKTALFLYTIDFLMLLVLMKMSGRKNLAKVSAFTATILVIYIGVIYWVRVQTGIWGFSTLQVYHPAYKAIDSGLYVNYHDAEIVNSISSVLENDTSVFKATSKVFEMTGGYIGLREFADYCIASDRIAFLKYNFELVLAAGLSSFSVFTYSYGIRTYFNIFNGSLTKISFSFCICLFMLVMSLYKWIKDRKVPLLIIGLAGGMLSIIVGNISGSFGDWGRLFVIIIPFMTVSFSIIFRMIIVYLPDQVANTDGKME